MAKKKAAKKKASPKAKPAASAAAETPAPPMPAMMPQMGMMPPAIGTPQVGNPMMQMAHMMQMMMNQGGGAPMMDPSAMPFAGAQAIEDEDEGFNEDFIRPALLNELVRTQEAVTLGSVLDHLCLNDDGTKSLGGIPKGCTIAFAGPPGKGKTRSALAGISRVAAAGEKVAFVVAEEGFHDPDGNGRDDLCSRFVKIGMEATGLNEKDFRKKVLENVFVLESQYHKGNSWDDFVTKYRYLVEQEEIGFVVIDSLNMLDPSRNRTADNLSSLKTYNHEQGVTCLCIGQIRDTGSPVGGEALVHTADVVFLIEEMSLGSKDIAEFWGGKYRDKIDVIRCVKSVTTPTFPHPVRLARDETMGILDVHESQPDDYAIPQA